MEISAGLMSGQVLQRNSHNVCNVEVSEDRSLPVFGPLKIEP